MGEDTREVDTDIHETDNHRTDKHRPMQTLRILVADATHD